MRLRKARLTAPMMALKANRMANCQGRGCGSPVRQAAAIRKVTKLAEFCTPASLTRYLPRRSGGTSAVIQGSQAQLEMPRERLKPNKSISISARRFFASRNPPGADADAL